MHLGMGRTPWNQKSELYRSYWNAFLFVLGLQSSGDKHELFSYKPYRELFSTFVPVKSRKSWISVVHAGIAVSFFLFHHGETQFFHLHYQNFDWKSVRRIYILQSSGVTNLYSTSMNSSRMRTDRCSGHH